MGATQTGDVVFEPKVWNDHINAYFDRKMGIGQLALMDKTLEAEGSGETKNFPYFKAIGDAQEPAQDEGLEVEPLKDDSFSVTVKEIGKAVGWKDKSIKKSAASRAKQEAEAQSQIARVLAEKVDKDLITTINAGGASTPGYVATTAAETCSIAKLIESKITAFGDKSNDAVACAMHSHDYLRMLTNGDAGFLKADANDPFWNAPGFMGRIGGMALFVLDTMPAVVGGINGKKAWQHFIFKANPFGIYMKQEMLLEYDRDILHRENVVASTMWYGTLSLHAKVSPLDYRIAKGAFASSINV